MRSYLLISLLVYISAFSSLWGTDKKISCYKEICNNQLPIKSYEEVIKESISNTDKILRIKDRQYITSIEKLVEKNTLYEIERWNERYQFYKEIKKNPKLLKDSSSIDFLLFVIQTEFLSRFRGYLERGVLTVNSASHLTSGLKYNKEKARFFLTSINYDVEAIDWIVDIEAYAFESVQHSRLLSYFLSEGNLPGYIFNTVLGNEGVSIFQASHSEINRALKELGQIDQKEPFYISNSSFIEKVKGELVRFSSLNEFPSFVLERINSILFFADLVIDYSKKDKLYQLMKSMPVKLRNYIKGKVLKVDVDLMNPEKISESNYSALASQNIKMCISNLKKSIAMTVTKSQVHNLRSEIRFLNSRAIDFVKKYAGKSIVREMESRLKRLQLNIPSSKNFLMNLSLDNISNYQERQLSFEDTPYMSSISSYGNFSFGSLMEDCSYGEDINSNIIDDRVLPSAQRPYMHLNWKTVKYLDRYKVILAHEFGHLVYRLLIEQFLAKPNQSSLMTIDELKRTSDFMNCTSRTHPNKPVINRAAFSNYDIQLNIKQYTSEDFADLFAGFVYRYSGTYNSICQFFNNSPILEILNSSKTDIHSASFYRLINIENLLRGKIPNSCKEIIDGYRDTLELNQCL